MLFGLKYWTGLVTGSVAIVADAFASALILAGIFLGRCFRWVDGVLGMEATSTSRR